MKRFLIKISYTVLPVWHLLVGMATYLWVTNDNSGDLMRLGLIDGGAEYTDSILKVDALPDIYFGSQDNDSLLRLDTCDVVVIGDSFSHGGGVGKTGDYVNCLAHDSGRRVILFTPGGDAQASPMQMAFDASRTSLSRKWSATLFPAIAGLSTTTPPCPDLSLNRQRLLPMTVKSPVL